MNAEQNRLVEAIDQLDITHRKLSSLVQAMEHMLRESTASCCDGNASTDAIFALHCVVEDYTRAAERDAAAVWVAIKPILAERGIA